MEVVKKESIKQRALECPWVMISTAGKKTVYSIIEPIFVEELKTEMKLISVNNKLYSTDGLVSEGRIKKIIKDKVERWILQAVASKIKSLYDLLVIDSHVELEVPKKDEFHFLNESYRIADEGIIPIEPIEFVVTRIPHSLGDKKTRPVCPKWTRFLDCMLEPEDVMTLQEYIGYCLIPATKAQKALFIKSGGGEGKSVLLGVMQHIFGDTSIKDKVQSVANNRFKLATLENKLVFLDDDLNTEGLKDTGLFKEIVTNNGRMTVEEKSKDSRPANIYIRYFIMGNADITSLYDHTEAFYDRILPLTTRGNKYRGADGENVNLLDELKGETVGILYWAMEGLERLHKQGYKFTHSEKTKKNIEDIKIAGDNVRAFWQSNYLEFATLKEWGEYSVSSKDLLSSYQYWCEQNGEVPRHPQGFSKSFKGLAETTKKAKYNDQLAGKRARGYEGVRLSSFGKVRSC